MQPITRYITDITTTVQHVSALYSEEDQKERAATFAKTTKTFAPFAIIVVIINVMLSWSTDIFLLSVIAHAIAITIFPLIIYLGENGKVQLLSWLPLLMGQPSIHLAAYSQGEPYVFLAFFALIPLWGVSLLQFRAMIVLSLLSPLNILIFYWFVPNALTFEGVIQWITVCGFIEAIFIFNTFDAWRREQAYREQIWQQEKTLVRHNAMQEYITSINHDFKTPLSIIQLNADMMSRYIDDEVKRDRHLTRITSSVTRINDIVEQSNRWLKLQADADIQLVDVSLTTVLPDIVTQLDTIATEKGITLKLRLPETNSVMKANHHLLDLALTEIIRNAIDFSPTGDTVTLTADADDTHITIHVNDEGMGISPQHLPHVFEPFYRGEAAREAKAGRNGLGLTLAKRAIELQKGHINIESAIGTGTTVSITLLTQKA